MLILKRSITVVISLLMLPFVLAWIPLPIKQVAEPPVNTQSIGQGDRNLIIMQPWVSPSDYVDSAQLEHKLTNYLEIARDQGWLTDQTIVLFPEHLGTWLIADGESGLISYMPNTTSALVWIVLRHFPDFLIRVFDEPAKDPVAATLFKLKAQQTANRYQALFEGLAAQYNVTIVAGSITLPNPLIRQNRITTGEGPIYNVSAVFTAQGLQSPLVKKIYPTTSEQFFTASATSEDLSVVTVNGLNIGILVCADSWYPDTYQSLSSADVFVVPSFATVDWDSPWQGYDGFNPPTDVNSDDIHRLTEGEAWKTYALAGRIGRTNASVGANAFLKGTLWDMTGYGQASGYVKNMPLPQPVDYNGPQIIQLRW